MKWTFRTPRPFAGIFLTLFLALSTVLPHGAFAQGAPDAHGHWRALAEIDSQAAMALVEDSHPGASAELHDMEFASLVATAKQHLNERIPRVADYPSYRAVMDGLAADFKDGHIWAHATVLPVIVRWTGIVLSRQDRQWIVASQLPMPGNPDVANARLLSCDGVDAQAWAKERVALFHGNAEIEAELVNAAPWLLFDKGNPFLKRPDICVFQRPGETPVQMTLHWVGATQDIVDDVVEKASTNSRIGLSIAPLDDGYWISLGTLKDEAAALVAEARHNEAVLRKARFVVVDLRGNGGGNSEYSQELASILVGDKRVSATDIARNCSGDYWRVSAENLEARLATRAGLEKSLQKPELAEYDGTTKGMQDALKAGRAFSPALPTCASQARKSATRPTVLPPSLMKGRLIIVTDHSCFSSCLLAVDLFRKVGAIQVGESTDISRRYMEVRQILLPSGLTYFSTLQKVALGEGNFGPYTPDVRFPGKMNDTTSLQAWVKTIANQPAGTESPVAKSTKD